MNKSIKMLMSLVAGFLMLLVPLAYGFNIEISGGDSQSSGTVIFDIDAGIGSTINSETTVNGAILNPEIAMNGDIGNLDVHHSVDINGNHAGIHAKVVNGEGIDYADSLYPEEGVSSPYVVAQQWLTVGHSDYIMCAQEASIATGDKAIADIKVYDGSLTGYHGIAFAGAESYDYAPYAQASQEFDSSEGSKIIVAEKASDQINDQASESIKISNGGIGVYYGSSAAGIEGMPMAIAGRFCEFGGNEVVIAEEASIGAYPLTGKSSAKIVNGYGALEGGIYGSPYSTMAAGEFGAVTGELLFAAGESVDLKASAYAEGEDGAYSAYANSKILNGGFYGINIAGYLPMMSEGLIAGQVGGAGGDSITLYASGTSPYDADSKNAKIPNADISLLNVVNVYPDGMVDIQQTEP